MAGRTRMSLLSIPVGAIAIAVVLVWTMGAAAQTPSPTPSATPDCTGAQIFWLNPDNDSGAGMATSSSLTGDVGVRLVAWVTGAPDGAQVDFDADTQGGTYFDWNFQQQTSPAAHVDVATDVQPDGGAYSVIWNTQGLGYDYAQGEYWSLTATLSVGGQTCDQDVETHTLGGNNFAGSGGPSAARITDPEMGGQLGFLVNPDGTQTAPVSFLLTNSMFGSGGSLLYTTSEVGTEPTWNACGTSAANNMPGYGVTTASCTLVGSDSPDDVTAVAVAAGSGSSATGSDAVTIESYVITPTTLTLRFLDGDPTGPPNVLSQVSFNQCTDVLQATVEDQFGEPIPHVNLDLHAVGPSDKLRVGSSLATDAFQAPDAGDHDTEGAADCPNDSGSDGLLQGDHDEVGRADIKHIESAGNTDLSGEFTWTMFLPGSSSAGDTQIEVWVDPDDNDTHCDSELSADAAIAWGDNNFVQSAGIAPFEDDCPIVQPSPQPTPTPSPTPTPTPAPTGPSPSASPTPQPTPTEAPTPEPDPVDVHSLVSIRNGFLGAIATTPTACENRREVVLKKKRPGKDRAVGSDISDRGGNWKIKMNRSGAYYAVATKKNITSGLGPPLVCLASKTVTLRLS
jgi:hypothetical protein